MSLFLQHWICCSMLSLKNFAKVVAQVIQKSFGKQGINENITPENLSLPFSINFPIPIFHALFSSMSLALIPFIYLAFLCLSCPQIIKSLSSWLYSVTHISRITLDFEKKGPKIEFIPKSPYAKNCIIGKSVQWIRALLQTMWSCQL